MTFIDSFEHKLFCDSMIISTSSYLVSRIWEEGN